MSFSICYIVNISGEVKTLRSKEFAIDEQLKIEDTERASWATNDDVISAIVLGTFQIYNCCGPIEGMSNQIDWLKEY